jgi:hypothetical protein
VVRLYGSFSDGICAERKILGVRDVTKRVRKEGNCESLPSPSPMLGRSGLAVINNATSLPVTFWETLGNSVHVAQVRDMQ